MMKKLLAALVILVTVAATHAADFKYQWHHTIYGKTKAGNTPVSIIKTTDGNYVAFTTFGSNTLTDTKLYFDGEPLKNAEGKEVEGCQYVGNNVNATNNNLLLQKYDQKTGDLLWTVYSDKGYLYNNQAIQPTEDGGLILISDVRNLADRTEKTLFRMVGADGVKTEVTYTPDSIKRTITEGVIAKIDKNGKVEWAKLIATTAHPMQKYFGGYAAFYRGLALDNKGNIYICGHYMSSMTFTKRDKTTETHEAKSAEGWDGTIQSQVGDPFIAKLDKDGYLLQFMTEDESNIKFASFDRIVIKEGIIYLSGRFQGNGTATIKFGDTILQPNDCVNIIYASLNCNDLSMNYIKSFVTGRFNGKSYGIQNKNLQYYNGSLYLTGLLLGSLADNATSSPFIAVSDKYYEALVVKIDAKDGKRLAAGIDGKGITGAFGVVETKDPKAVWVYGYALFGMSRLNKYTLEDNKMVKGTEEVTLNKAQIGMVCEPLIDGTGFVSMGRASNDSGTILGATGEPTTFFSWGIVLTKHTCDDILPDEDTSTGIKDVNVQKDRVANCNVYTLAGVLVKRSKTMAEATSGLPSGLYIIGGKKIVVK